MKVSHLTSTPSLKRLDVASVHVVFEDFLGNDEYRSAYLSKLERGELVYQVGAPVQLPVTGAIARSPIELGRIKTPVVGLIVDTVEDYVKYSPDVDLILFGSTGMNRIMDISVLVRGDSFDRDVEHWLWGVPNPVELAVYQNLFSAFVTSRFRIAICESCFQYSMYGVRFSRQSGLLASIDGLDGDGMLGMSRWWNYEPTREQYRVFLDNQSVVSDFASGRGGDEYVENVRAILEGGNETKTKAKGVL